MKSWFNLWHHKTKQKQQQNQNIRQSKERKERIQRISSYNKEVDKDCTFLLNSTPSFSTFLPSFSCHLYDSLTATNYLSPFDISGQLVPAFYLL
jgi:GTP1/Obg family GTP-binding protein